MSEARFAGRVSCHLRQLGAVVQRIETPRTGAGVPDLAYAYDGVAGWVELKHLTGWPARPTTPVRLDRDARKFRLQTLWLEAWARASDGPAWVLAQVGRDFLLWSSQAGETLVEGRPRAHLEALARRQWRGTLDYRQLLEALTTRDR